MTAVSGGRPARSGFAAVAVGAAVLAACDGGYVETGDLAALRERGALRVLVPRQGESPVLPRHGHPLDFERELATSFARSVGLEPVLVWIDRYDDLIPALVEGRGDMIAAGLSVTDRRAERIAFSLPLDSVAERVATRAEDSTLDDPADLAGRRVVVRPSSAFWETVEGLRGEHPEIGLVAAPEDLETEQILHGVAMGEYDVTVADDGLLTEVLAYTPELRAGPTLVNARPVAWGVRRDAPQLLAAVNEFLESAAAMGVRRERYGGDLEALRERGVLRVLTRNSAATYFVWRGRLMGFEYDLARRFARRLGLHLQIIVPPTRSALLSWLRQGRGDVVAASLTITPGRAGRGIDFSRPYQFVRETVVARAADSLLRHPEDLEGRTVVVRRSSSYWETASRVLGDGIAFELTAAPESLETEEIIDRVASGEYDLTIADSHILAIELTWRDDVRDAFPLTDSISHGWAVREDSPSLRAAIDAFFDEEYRGLFYNLTYNRYFRTPRRIADLVTERVERTGRLSPYDSIIVRYAREYGFDWRLIAAQMYEESRFDPEARSFAGAVGLMQVLPSTAEVMGIDSLEDPANAVHAGVRHLDGLYRRLDIADDTERLWFALAAYNAGSGHVLDARRLAGRLGRNADVWFGDVSEVMPLLARSEYHRRARFGYCRCSEPVRYVRRIRERYRAYAAVTDGDPGRGREP